MMTFFHSDISYHKVALFKFWVVVMLMSYLFDNTKSTSSFICDLEK